MNRNGLTRFVENYSINSKSCADVTSDARFSEAYHKISSGSLKESTEYSSEDLIIALNNFKESKTPISEDVFNKVVLKLREKNISSGPKLWKFPVGRINDYDHPNLNGRCYTRPLWENVITKQREAWEGLCGLADHPENDDPGKFKDSSIVWLDMMIDDAQKVVYAIGSFVGKYGHLAQEIIEAGGRIGFSSSGFGEIMPDGRTVNPETFQIERVADIVLNPSQGVFGEITDAQPRNIEYSKQEPITSQHESIDLSGFKEYGNSINESTVTQPTQPSQYTSKIKEEIKMENTPEGKVRSALNKVETKAFIKYVNTFLEDSNEIRNPVDRLSELNDIMEIVEDSGMVDLKEQVENRLVAERDRLYKMVTESQNIEDELGMTATELKEKAAEVVKENAKLEEAKAALEAEKAEIEAAKATIANRSAVLDEQVEDYDLVVNELVSRNKTLSEEVENLKKEHNTLYVQSSFKEAAQNQNISAKDAEINELKERVEKLRTANSTLRGELSEAKTENSKLAMKQKLNESLKIKFDNLKEAHSKLKEKYDEAVAKFADSQDDNARLETKVADLEKSTLKISEKYDLLQSRYKTLKESIVAAPAKAPVKEEKTVVTEPVKESVEPSEKPAEKPAEKIVETTTTEVKVGDKVVEAVVPAEVSIQKHDYTSKTASQSAKIESYWNDLRSRYGESIDQFEDKIRGAKTLSEATMNFLDNLKYIDNNAKYANTAIMREGVSDLLLSRIEDDMPTPSYNTTLPPGFN